MKQVLAVDLGGTKTATALVDSQGNIHNKKKQPAARTLAATVDQIAAESANAKSIGIIIPGIYDPTNGTAWAPNLWGWDPVPLRDAIQQRLGNPAIISSDRSGYVIGEQWQGVANGFRNIVFVAVGTGIGVGIIADGHLIEGAHGIAGAAGWMTLDPTPKPEYDQCGCWESEAAGPAFARRAGYPTAEEAAAAARAGDLQALDAVDHTARYLAMGIANLISIFDPEIVVLGGGLMKASDLLLDRIRQAVPQWAQPIAVKKTTIELTMLGEDAGLLGAAGLAFLRAGQS